MSAQANRTHELTPDTLAESVGATFWPLADRILLVEDSEPDVLIFRRTLTQAGSKATLDIVTDGETAIGWLTEILANAGCGRSVLPRAIFLDLKLPGIHGTEVLRWIGAQPALGRTLVAVCTGSNATRDRAEAEQLGAHVYLMKHPRPERLAALLAITDPRLLPTGLSGFPVRMPPTSPAGL